MIEANLTAGPRGLGLRPAPLAAAAAVGLALAIAGPAPARQQPSPSTPPAPAAEPGPPQDDPDAPAPAPAEDEPTPEEEDRQEVLADSVFVDPKATAAMRGDFEELYPSVLPQQDTYNRIVQMARGGGRLDPALIDRFVKGAARQLTDHDHIAAVSQPDGQFNRIQAIQDGARSLMAPYAEVPADQRDRRFLQAYNAKLLEVAPELLRNHLYARVQVMQALSRMGDPQALGLLLSVLGDPEQPIIVKQLAAEGVKQIAIESAGTLQANEREQAAVGLVTFVRSNPDAYWFAQARALQALGALRAVSGIQNRDQAVFADAAMDVLSADGLRIETRAWAGWSLGMFEIPANYPQLNYSLAAYQIGRLAEQVGERIVELSDPREGTSADSERVKYLTGLVVAPIFEALDGNASLRGSGLKNLRALGPHQGFVNRVHQAVRQLAASSVMLTRAVGAQQPAARDGVIAALNELRNVLNQNTPEDRTFVPGGREFALAEGSRPVPVQR